MMHRLSWSCVRWAVAALVVGVLAEVSIAWAQDRPMDSESLAHDPSVLLLVELLKGGGLPAVLAMAAWWARGLLGQGIPVVVQLSERDREVLSRLRTVGEHTDHGVPRHPEFR
jgi:hypothetical protein